MGESQRLKTQKVDDNLLQEMTRRLVSALDPEQIILFGSRVWGVPTETSDVDLFVVVEESQLPPALRARAAHRCLRGLNIPKDVLVRTRAEADKYRAVSASLEYLIFEKGRVLYERH
ncbi:MAG: nucleotidyltransferase domain-containing protein [Desulfuromonadaceae bacterium]|nr:nucleotidyltransferase domain-containing protein [Desulfuromonadaceae bacterium]